MNTIKRRMIQRAMRVHKRIFPCSQKEDLLECFTQQNDRILFWFNTEDKTTHVMTRKVPQITQEAIA